MGGKTVLSSGDQVLADLLERVSRRDREAFAELYAETSPKLFGLAVRTLHNESLAEDALQEVYLQVWASAGKYENSKGRVLTWMLTLCHRRCVDRIRTEERRKEREANLLSPSPPSIDRTDQLEIAHTVAALPDKQKEIIGLVYYEGYTAREASEKLSLPLATAKTRLRDALGTLRKEWR